MSLGTPLPPASSPDGSTDDGGLLGGATGFDGLLETAVRERTARQGTPGLLLASELDPIRLCRYAGGALSGTERSEVERVLSRSRWAVGRVAALVRVGRAGNPNTSPYQGLARRLLQLDASQSAQAAPEALVGTALLEALGADPAAPSAALSTQGPARAAALLALGRLEEARRSLDDLPPGSPLLELARRIAGPGSEPWVEVLSAL